MVSESVVAELLLILLWLYVLLAWMWPCTRLLRGRLPPLSAPPPAPRAVVPPSFPGLTVKPPCAACAEAASVPVTAALSSYHPCSGRPAAVRDSLMPPPSFARMGTVPIIVARTTALSRTMAIPVAAPGGNGPAPHAQGLPWRRTARRCTARGSQSTAWCGPSAR